MMENYYTQFFTFMIWCIQTLHLLWVEIWIEEVDQHKLTNPSANSKSHPIEFEFPKLYIQKE